MDGYYLAGGLVAEDVVGFDDHGANGASVPEMNIGAAYACTADTDVDFAMFETFAGLDVVEGRAGVSDPEIMFGIRVYANIGLREFDGLSRRHYGDWSVGVGLVAG